MLAIRLQRVGRSGLAQYRIIVQEALRQPTSGRVVAFVGTYNPHTKESKVQVETAQKFLDNGAQPSPRVIKLLTDAGVKMPNWVAKARVNTKVAKKAEKLRKNQPKDAPVAKKEAEAESPEQSRGIEIDDELAVEPATDVVEEPVSESTEE